MESLLRRDGQGGRHTLSSSVKTVTKSLWKPLGGYGGRSELKECKYREEQLGDEEQDGRTGIVHASGKTTVKSDLHRASPFSTVNPPPPPPPHQFTCEVERIKSLERIGPKSVLILLNSSLNTNRIPVYFGNWNCRSYKGGKRGGAALLDLMIINTVFGSRAMSTRDDRSLIRASCI
ncbi:hypothetical protein YC2023_115939 [Brassica napus]